MQALIVYPAGEQPLAELASKLGQAVKKAFLLSKVELVTMDALDSPHLFLQSDIILLGTPCLRNDICWPIQVKIDGLIHKYLKQDFSKKKVSGFCIASDAGEAHRCLSALLWTFNETSAKVLKGLAIMESDGQDDTKTRINEFITLIKNA